jgi:hypothetical protein
MNVLLGAVVLLPHAGIQKWPGLGLEKDVEVLFLPEIGIPV